MDNVPPSPIIAQRNDIQEAGSSERVPSEIVPSVEQSPSFAIQEAPFLSEELSLQEQHQDESLSPQPSAEMHDSGSGTSLRQMLKTMTALPDVTVRHFDQATMHRTLCQIHETVETLLYHTAEDDRSRTALTLMRDLTQTSILNQMVEVEDLLATYSTLQSLSQVYLTL